MVVSSACVAFVSVAAEWRSIDSGLTTIKHFHFACGSQADYLSISLEMKTLMMHFLGLSTAR